MGDLYSGGMGRALVDAARQAGGGLTREALRDALPRTLPALVVDGPGHDQVALLPPPADGGLATAAALRALIAAPQDLAGAQNRALAVAGAWRARGGQGDPMALLAASLPPAALPPLPASAGFAALDKDGRAVACAVSMNNLFGTGRIAPGTGILLAASPAIVPPPLLSAGVAWNANLRRFKAAVAASGQEAAPLAAADALAQILRGQVRVIAQTGPATNNSDLGAVPRPALTGSIGITAPPDPGRANMIYCGAYLPGAPESCRWIADPRGAGLAVGSN